MGKQSAILVTAHLDPRSSWDWKQPADLALTFCDTDRRCQNRRQAVEGDNVYFVYSETLAEDEVGTGMEREHSVEDTVVPLGSHAY